MRQKVADVKHGVVVRFAYFYGNYFAVLFSDYAVKSERNGSPLILADSAVIMGLGKSNAVIFVQRHLLQVKARVVDMRADYSYAVLFNIAGADFDNENGFASVVIIEFVALFYFFGKIELLVAILFCFFDYVSASFALGLAFADKRFVALRVIENGFHRLFVRSFVNVGSFIFFHVSLLNFF